MNIDEQRLQEILDAKLEAQSQQLTAKFDAMLDAKLDAKLSDYPTKEESREIVSDGIEQIIMPVLNEILKEQKELRESRDDSSKRLNQHDHRLDDHDRRIGNLEAAPTAA